MSAFPESGRSDWFQMGGKRIALLVDATITSGLLTEFRSRFVQELFMCSLEAHF